MKVVGKQNNSKLCIICGVENEAGVKAPFYIMEDGSVASIFEYKEIHQSYPGRVHGGMITCMLDELAGRAIWNTEPETLAVTTSLNIKFRKPVPYEEKLKALGKITFNSKRGFTAIGFIYKMDGTLLAEAEMNYLKLPAQMITDADTHEELNIYIPDDVTEIDF